MSKKIRFSSVDELNVKIAGLQEIYSHVEVVSFGIGFCIVWILAWEVRQYDNTVLPFLLFTKT